MTTVSQRNYIRYQETNWEDTERGQRQTPTFYEPRNIKDYQGLSAKYQTLREGDGIDLLLRLQKEAA